LLQLTAKFGHMIHDYFQIASCYFIPLLHGNCCLSVIDRDRKLHLFA